MSGTGPNTDTMGWGRASRFLGQRQAETGPAMVRTGGYGEPTVEIFSAKSLKAADEGSYFVVRSPTPGTGLATIAAPTSYSATSPFIIVQNGNPAAGPQSVSVFLDFIKLTCTAAGTAGTNLNYTVVTDQAFRYSSGGAGSANTGLTTLLLGPYSPNMGTTRGSLTQVYAGALTATAASIGLGSRILYSGALRNAIPVVGDSYFLNFGGHEFAPGSAVTNGTNPTAFQHGVGPVGIPPGGSALVHVWLASQSAASSYELEMGLFER